MNEEKQKKRFMIIISVLLILVLLGGGTYAWLTLQLKGTKVNVLKAGNLALILDDENSIGIHQEKAVPTLDKVGETFDPYHFTLENLSDMQTGYTIYLDDLDLEEGEERMLDEYLRYSLTKDGVKKADDLTSTGENPNRVLDSGTISGGQTITYDLRLWINISTGNEAMGKAFRGKIRVVALQEEYPEATEECYVFDTTNKKITDYLCYEGNTVDMPTVTQIEIPETIDGVTVESIGASAFANKNLESVTIPNSVTQIGNKAFFNNKLTSIDIPSGISTLANQTFQHNQLTSVTIPENVTQVGGYAFANNQIASIQLHDKITLMGPEAFNDNKLPDAEAFFYQRKADGSIDRSVLVSYGGAKRTNVIIPNTVKTIYTEAMGNNNLVSVGMQEGIESIGSHAFANNNLMSITIPSTVTSIGTSAFLKNTSGASSNINLTKIINKTGRRFNFGTLTGGTGNFIIGTVVHTLGNIVVEVDGYSLKDIILTKEGGVSKIAAKTTPTFTETATTDDGMYAMNDNQGTSYYYRGAINDNYVSFAGLTWRIIRINGDGTIRLIAQDGINNNAKYNFNTTVNNFKYMYYSNSTIKNTLNTWYQTKLSTYESKIATGTFCEQAKVKADRSWTSGSARMTTYNAYTPSLTCANDGNSKGVLTSKIGLPTYDEVNIAGGIVGTDNASYYLSSGANFWTMSPAGYTGSNAGLWFVTPKYATSVTPAGSVALRPVINVLASTLVSGTGEQNTPYIIK